MATKIQNDRARLELDKEAFGEQKRSNAAREAEERRSNKARERENRRHNKQTEKQADRANYGVKFRNVVSGIKDIGSALSNVSDTAKTITSTVMKAKNDWAWYFKDTKRMKDVANYPSKHVYGRAYNMVPTEEALSPTGAPGILALEVSQTIGHAQGSDSAIQRAADNMFIEINSTTGRNSDYEPADLFIQNICLASFDSYLDMLKRAYRALRTATWDNAYTPRAMVELMGFDYDDFESGENLYLFKAHINYMEDMKARYLLIPGMSIQKRWKFEMSHVFKDDDTNNTQYYFYTPRHFFKLVADTSAPTYAQPMLWNESTSADPTKHTLAQVVAFSKAFIDGFNGVQDYKIMRSDIFKYFGEAAEFKPDYLDGSEILEPIVDVFSLTQFRNATIHGYTRDFPTWNITQDNNSNIYHVPSVNGPGLVESYSRRPIMFDYTGDLDDVQTAAALTEFTRLVHFAEKGSLDYYISTPATTVVNAVRFAIPTYIDVNSAVGNGDIIYVIQTGNNQFITPDDAFVLWVSAYSSFEFAPLTVLAIYDSALNGQKIYAKMFQWDEYFDLNSETLAEINETIALTLFGFIDRPAKG